MKYLGFTLLVVAIIADICWTLSAIHSHLAIEGNPLMQWVLNKGEAWFVVYKMIPIMGLLLAKQWVSKKFWINAAWIAFIGYMLIYIMGDLKINLG